MRMSAWTDDIISFMEDANRFTSYFDYLAAIVKDHTPPMGRICDAGCGMGQLALALAPFASAVDAVDTSAAATDYVGHLARREDASNVRAVRADMRLLQPEARYDTMAFCLSASVADALAIARRCCIGKVVVVNKIQAKMDACRGNGSEPSGVRARKPGAAFDAAVAPADERTVRPLVYNFEETLLELARRGICSEGRELSIDYGQPFRTLKDAQRYFALFRTRSFPGGVTTAQLAHLLNETGNDEFPYYLPIRRHLAAYVLDAGSLQETA